MAVRSDAQEYLYRTTDLPDSTAFSVLLWIYLATDRNTYNTFATLIGGTYGHLIGTASDGTTIMVMSQSGNSRSGASLSIGTWYHVAITKASSAGKTRGWLNGSNFGDAAATSNSLTQVRLCANSWSSNEYLDGRIAAVKIYSGVELSADEISAEMEFYTPQRLANLNTWLPCVDNSVAGCAVDYSGNGYSMSTSGSLTIEDGPPIRWARAKDSKLYTYSAATGSVTVDVSAQSLLFSQQTITFILDYTTTQTVQSAVFNDQAPTVELGVTTTATEQTATFTGQAPDISLGATTTVTENTATFTGQAPTYEFDYVTTVTEQTATFSDQAPTVNFDYTTTVTENAATFNDQSPAVELGPSIFPDVQTVTMNDQSPAVNFDMSVAQNEQTLTFGAQAPSISLDWVVTAVVNAATFNDQAPTVITVGDETVNVTVIPALFSEPAPTVSGEASTTPTVQTATFSNQDPLITISVSVLIGSDVAATFSIQTPTYLYDMVVAALVQELTMINPAPTIQTTGTGPGPSMIVSWQGVKIIPDYWDKGSIYYPFSNLERA